MFNRGIMFNNNTPFDIINRIEILEQKFQQLKNDIDALFEITNKIRPKYYKLQENGFEEIK